MDVERLVDTYVKGQDTLKRLAARQAKFKELLVKAVDADGEPDEKGHVWLAAGDFVLQRQKRQGKPTLDQEAALDWATGKGIYDEVVEMIPVLDEDALAGWVFEHKEDEGVEDEYAALWITPDPTYAFIEPARTTNYDY